MREVWDGDAQVWVRFPDCEACGDEGQILIPLTHYQGRGYIGHGPGCRCRACRDLSPAFREWLDYEVLAGRIRALPAEAAEKGRQQDEVRFCPLCDEGRRFREAIRDHRLFRMRPAQRLHPESEIGAALLEENRAMRTSDPKAARAAVRRRMEQFARGRREMT